MGKHSPPEFVALGDCALLGNRFLIRKLLYCQNQGYCLRKLVGVIAGIEEPVKSLIFRVRM